MIEVIFDGGEYTIASKVYAYDYGQELRIWGLRLPAVVEAHFSRCGSDKSFLSMGTCDGDMSIIPVPDEMLKREGSFKCVIFFRNNNAGESEYMMQFNVLKRSSLPSVVTEPTESDTNYFDSVLSSMEELCEQAQNVKQELLNSFGIGTVETLEGGEEATANITSGDNGLTLNLGIPKGDQGEPDAFCVTIIVPGSNQSPIADKTYAEIQDAIKQGKRVYAYAPESQYVFFKSPDAPFEPETVYELFYPSIKTTVNGTVKKYAFFGYASIIANNRLPVSLDNDFDILVEGYAIFDDDSVESRHIKNAVGNLFQKKLIFDNIPTENSEHPITSGGVYTMLEALEQRVAVLEQQHNI